MTRVWLEGGGRVIKQERMPDGHMKLMLRDKETGEFGQAVVEA